ncbi:LysR family transcriptional regulator [Helicobacter mesocricetorum]|uniref:LysR family transcriptional regulator n=1 Tax=Helicobacter mesocricetorum TaxID=87012 RepID=UPI000CF0B84E|nr:LysR family transcriptional regulator [Helicobacter mesocricetorum]
MLRDFEKLQTFMIVAQEKSVSKASMKIGISQPAVTRHIKIIESYFNTKMIYRKKRGVLLTKDGESLFCVLLKLNKTLQDYQRDMVMVIKRCETIKIACSYTVGNFLLPQCFMEIKDNIYPNIEYYVATSTEAISDLQDKKCELAIVESRVFKKGIVYREWLEDELVLVCNKPLLSILKKEDLCLYQWIGLKNKTHTAKIVKKYLDKLALKGYKLNISLEFDSLYEMKNFLTSKVGSREAYIGFLPYLHIRNELSDKMLYTSSIRGLKLKRKMFLAFAKHKRSDSLIENISHHILFNTQVSMY